MKSKPEDLITTEPDQPPNFALFVHPVEGRPLWYVLLDNDGLSFSGTFEGAPTMEPSDEARCDGYSLTWDQSPHWRPATMPEALRVAWELRFDLEALA